jgi:hypothetical protein
MSYYKLRYKRTCRYCLKEFLAKMPHTEVCYEEECQLMRRRMDRRKQTAKASPPE